MDNTVAKVALAALLHDVGKFAERAGMEMSARYRDDNEHLYQPQYDGRRTHRHALYTAAFIENHADLLPQLDDPGAARSGDSLINLAAMHHKPETPLQWIVTQSDRLSSGLDRQMFEGNEAGISYRDYRKTRLIPLAEELLRGKEFYGNDANEAYSHRLPLGELSARQIFPVTKAAREQTDEAAGAEYAALFEGFTRTLARLEHRSSPHLWMDHFVSLWERFTSAIPAATVGKVIADVSLFDHCRSTAALASALYGYHAQAGTFSEASIKDNAADKFLLVTADFYGIQNFIFSEGGSTNRAAAKLLRGRSFAVSLLAELAADRLCRALGLPVTSVLLNAAGKFTLLAPNLPESHAIVTSVEQELNRWLIRNYYGEVSIGFSSVPASGNDFAMNSFPDLWERLGRAADAKKYRKLPLDDHAGVVSGYLDSFDNRLGICPFCGKRPANSLTSGDKYLGDNDASCLICRDQIHLGAQIISANRLALVDAATSPAGGLKEPLFGCYQIMFDPDGTSSASLAASGALCRLLHLARSGEQHLGNLATRYINGYVPVYTPADEQDTRLLHGRKSDEKKLELVDMIRSGGAKSFHHIAKSALSPRSDADDTFTGTEALGILKADVDNLGKLFACGLPPERLNISRLATLSRQVNGFFTMFLPSLLAEDPRFRDIYTVFAGGDDLFLIGPWNRIIEFAPVLRDHFEKFACGNPAITISVGITVDKPGVPVPALADRAEKALHDAKAAGRNRVTVFGETVTWDEFASLQQKLEQLHSWQQQGYLGKAMLYRLNEFMEMARKEKRLISSGRPIDMEDMSCLAWRSRFTYSATRNAGRGLDRETRKKALDEVMQLAAWLHDYDGKLKIAVWQLLYNQR